MKKLTPKIIYSALAIGLALSSAALAATQEEADALFADQNWAGAASAYEELLESDADNGQNWFRLGRARHQIQDYEGANSAYAKALEAGFQGFAFAKLLQARTQMSLGNEDQALEDLEAIAKVGGITHWPLENATEFQPLTENARFLAVIEALKPCNTDEFRHFDFWLGQWDVTAAGAQQPTASSSITATQAGCVVLEQYQAGRFSGMSINFYDQKKGRWHQTWMSNAGGSVYLEGDLNEDGAMVLTDKDLPISKVTGTINRVTWTPNPDGSVRQHWQSSTDGGETWATAFDGIYVKKKD